MTQMTGSALIVGSVPLASTDAVFRACSHALEPYLYGYPDGEVGPRRFWIFYLASNTYAGHPDLENVAVPDSGNVTQPARGESEDDVNDTWWQFQLREGVEDLVFDSLHYAEPASDSYAVFTQLRRDGVIPPETRFQVTLPATGSAIMPFFAKADEWPLLFESYRAAMRRELQHMVAAIPAHDLIVQWDIATEVRDLLAGDGGLFPWAPQMSLEDKWAMHLRDFEGLSAELPEPVCLGYHFCFGTWGGWPHSMAPDASVCVRLANEAVARAGRRVDYVHVPVMPDATDEFFAPLRDLRIGDARIYLGVVLGDGSDAFVRRAVDAGRYLPRFGIASYCGWGREDPDRVPALLADLRECCEVFATMDMGASMR